MMGSRPSALVRFLGFALVCGCVVAAPGGSVPISAQEAEPFATSDRCIACHQGVTTRDGVGVSIGHDWRASMMANSARDPYWQAAVRREVMDYPEAASEIEAQCSRCHMPMASAVAAVAEHEGGAGQVFANLSAGGDDRIAALAADGVSCTVCHRVAADNLGMEDSFSGGFAIDLAAAPEGSPVFGPFEPDSGGTGDHALGHGVFAPNKARTCSRPGCARRATLSSPHSVRPGGEAENPRVPRAGPLPGVAGERLRRRTELPGLPHARSGRGSACDDGAGARPARGLQARLPGRQLLHAEDAGPLPGRAGDGPRFPPRWSCRPFAPRTICEAPPQAWP